MTVLWPGSISPGGWWEFLSKNWFGTFLANEQRSIFLHFLREKKHNQIKPMNNLLKASMMVKDEM